jgi:hypothetical protein
MVSDETITNILGISDGRDGDPNAMMAGAPQYGQQYGANPQLKVSGVGYTDQYNQYRGPNPPGGVPTGQPGQSQPYYANAGGQSSGYPGKPNNMHILKRRKAIKASFLAI